VTVDFGLTGALHRHADIARLAPLPSAANPRFIFLGVLKDRRTAVFLVSSDVEDMLGDGVCRPIPEDCETIELQKGETEFFELTTKDGRWIQYQMDVKDVHVGKVDAAEAIASYARASVAGQKLVRAAALKRGVQALRAYHYVPAQGVLVPAKPRAGARAAGSGPRRYVFGPGEVSVFRTLPAAR